MSKPEKDDNIENNPEEGGEANSQPQKEEKLVIMKKGDYNVHILIEEVKNLIEIEEGDLPVPRVKMTVFDKAQRTSKMKKPCDSFVFNEHFYFDKTNLTAEMLDSEKITIEVYDNKHTHKEDYFGIYEFDFGYVYNQDDHALHNIWIGLANPESDNISKIRGYLKLSISVLQESDPRVELESVDNELSNCIIPAQIQMKYKQISFYFFQGEEFPDMDATFSTKKIGRRCDGYIEVKYMGIVRKTKIAEMTKEKVVWNQISDIPATKPAVSQKICMVVKDKDVTSDDIVGSIEMKVDDIFDGHYNELQYLNIYGSPINKKGGIYDQMNYNAEIGSRWNGRILMKCVVTDVDSPIARVTDIPDDIVKQAKNCSRSCMWKIWFRALSAMYLPEETGSYDLRVSIQEKDHVFRSRGKAINGCVDFYDTADILLNTFTNDKFELPDIFIHLIDKNNKLEKQNICFQRVKADQFYLNKDILVLKLLPDPCIGKCKNMMKSGILRCKIYVYNQALDKDIISIGEFNKGGKAPKLKSINQPEPVEEIIGEDDDLENLLNAPKKEDKVELVQEANEKSEGKMYTVVAIVYMSKGLIAAESDGTSDPFVTLTFGSDKLQTSVKNNTMNGIWNEKLVFNNVLMNFNDYTTWPIFLLSVFDYNKIKSNVPLGYNYLWLCNAAYAINDTKLRQPKWHNLFLPKSNKQQGQILLSFYIFDEAHTEMKNSINYIPEVSLYNCEINVLGLRQLKPLGMIEVKKPFIKFDLNSLNVTGKPEDAHANIQTVPVSGGANPTINTVIKFDAKLPQNDIFMPELQCEVYDHMLAGLHNSLLGVFSLDLKKLIDRTKKQINEDTRAVAAISARKTLQDGLVNSIINIANNNNMIQERDRTHSLLPELEEEENIISTSTKDIAKSKDPLSTMYMEEQKEKEKEKQKVLDISTSLANKNNDNIQGDDDSDKNSDDQFMEEDEYKIKEKGEKINIDELNMNKVEIAIPMRGRKLTVANTVKLDGNFLKNNLNCSDYFVLYPNLMKYEIPGFKSISSEGEEKVQKEFWIEDTSKAPDKKLYFEIGYLLKAQQDIPPEETTKHYRRLYGCPLENVDVKDFKIKSPFNVGKIRRGKYTDKTQETSLFDAMKDIKAKVIHRYGEEQNVNEEKRDSIGSQLSQVGFMGKNNQDEKAYGKFKGLIRIASKVDMDNYNKEIEKSKLEGNIERMKNLNKYENLRKRLINKKSVIIRVYVLELNNLAKKDLLSESDPYIKILLNDKEIINERKNYQDNQKNCKWYKMYDIAGEIPGSSSLKIEVWDWDEILTDDLIGYTVIDLEDRYYNDDWQSMKEKPVEVRPLLHHDLNGAQGQVYMWLEIFESSEKSNHLPWKIDPQPICEMQVRLIIWETEEMELMDVEGTSDIYVIGYIEQKEMQKTDIHYRCQTGNASFNWRMLLPLKIPVQKPVVTIQVYDKDIFSSDDYMCGATIDLKSIIDIPKHLEMPVTLNKELYDGLKIEQKKPLGDIEFLSKEDDEEQTKFWVQCYKGKKEAAGQGEKSGRVMCSLEILPKNLADLDKVGKGRDNPNVNPYLPPPVGRMEFTLNPFKMMNQCVGPKFRRKCYCYCLCCLLVAYLVFALPSIFSGILV